MRTIPTLFLLFAFAFAGCGSHGTSGTGGSATTGSSNPCIDDPASCMGTCIGQCAPDAPGFQALMFQVWSGPVGSTPPACPAETPSPGTGFLDNPPDSVTCAPACACGPSQNACFLPVAMTANTAACPANGTGVQHLPSNSPDVWDGACTTQGPVSSADSLTVSPSLLGLGPACPSSNTTATEVQGGSTIALTCQGLSAVPSGKCPNGEVCAYGNVDGFSLCIVQSFGDVSCPSGWPNKHLYYDQTELCRCSCGDPVGESCTTTITVYEDTACSKPLGSAEVSADKPAACVDVSPGSAFGSKSATPPAFNAGTCAPTLVKTKPWTLCCLP